MVQTISGLLLRTELKTNSQTEKSKEIGLLEQLLEDRFPAFRLATEDRLQEREEYFQTKLGKEVVGLCREECTGANSSLFMVS